MPTSDTIQYGAADLQYFKVVSNLNSPYTNLICSQPIKRDPNTPNKEFAPRY